MENKINTLQTNNDYVVEIDNESGQTSIITEHICKELDAIIISTQNKTEVIVESELDYLILHRREHQGVTYYCPRARTTTPIENLHDYPTYEEFNLNEKLILTVIGRKGEKVKVIFRFG